jgi:hypothetical protein
MQGFVAQKLNDFETGKISRRRLIETLTLAATTAYAADSAQAQENPLKAQLINHLSYTCPDFKKAADWYSMVLNCDQVGQTKRDVVVVFGKKGEQPYNVTAKDVPHSHLTIQARVLNSVPTNRWFPRETTNQAANDKTKPMPAAARMGNNCRGCCHLVLLAGSAFILFAEQPEETRKLT